MPDRNPTNNIIILKYNSAEAVSSLKSGILVIFLKLSSRCFRSLYDFMVEYNHNDTTKGKKLSSFYLDFLLPNNLIIKKN